MDRSELQKEIAKKSMADSEFRKELMANPKETVKKYFGEEFSDEINVNIIEENDSDINFIIPQTSSELSDNELDNVAGGSCYVHVGCALKGCKTKFW